jgi:hypothetical protein
MAFPAASGYGNLPLGNFSPIIFSKRVLKFFKAISVADEVTNTDFEGEITQMGDTVRIIQQPIVTVTPYARGTILQPQDLIDNEITLTIDQANSYVFRMNDIEKAHEIVSFQDLATDAGAYALRNAYDIDVLGRLLAGATTYAATGQTSASVSIGYNSTDAFTPYNLINRLARLMDDQKVPDDGGRYIVAPPIFFESLGKEDSKLVDILVTGDPESMMRNRKMGTSRPLAGFTCFKTPNAPLDAGNSANYTVIAGHVSACATAKSILISETLRDPDTFGDLYRGLFVWGRKVVRPEAVYAAYVTFSS